MPHRDAVKRATYNATYYRTLRAKRRAYLAEWVACGKRCAVCDDDNLLAPHCLGRTAKPVGVLCRRCRCVFAVLWTDRRLMQRVVKYWGSLQFAKLAGEDDA